MISLIAGLEQLVGVAKKSGVVRVASQGAADAEDAHPAASVDALLGGWGEQPEQLRQELADVALLYEPYNQ